MLLLQTRTLKWKARSGLQLAKWLMHSELLLNILAFWNKEGMYLHSALLCWAENQDKSHDKNEGSRIK